jgi:hypothetical protein
MERGWLVVFFVLSSFLSPAQFVTQALQFGMIVASALIIWKSLMLVTGSESPIVVVLSGSMEVITSNPSNQQH